MSDLKEINKAIRKISMGYAELNNALREAKESEGGLDEEAIELIEEHLGYPEAATILDPWTSAINAIWHEYIVGGRKRAMIFHYGFQRFLEQEDEYEEEWF